MRDRQASAIEGFERAANKLARVSSRTSPIMESLGGFAIAVVVLYSGYTVIIRGNPPGSLFSFITSVIMLYEPLKRVAELHVDLSSSLFGVGMLYEFLDAGDFEEDPRHAPDLTVTEGRIEFRDVVFGYRSEERVLHSVNFVAEAGKTMALVGRSGGGKSTVMNLILRLYEIESGQILCDGIDHRDGDHEVVAPADRLCLPGELPVQGIGARQHRARPPRGDRRGNRGRRQGRLCA